MGKQFQTTDDESQIWCEKRSNKRGGDLYVDVQRSHLFDALTNESFIILLNMKFQTYGSSWCLAFKLIMITIYNTHL